ncbi:hypothetical protein BRDID11004_60430 [Bradyrhizobium diazoefficiens]|uniref:Uncharacterized protein n=1 Tax=Bradyrhizobium diazoefficiens TaxID=1355477 RepID=A0A810AM31_9BRAD|nr:hypothetical protein [Bradyrhizobium diazoefficiens]BBZ93059.1 hypothetical protein F07S3_28920 [Bradyrhizobium diazoefficiens]BCA10809.1 hypothetical protein BDHF08_26560 [Bradyrhizobium diazoefficiens]BCE55145.1 hypothetical protein XF5B_26570 [Bradyrhizobium diazoefficiens]BCE63878.1 hypothetical protein XF6B_26770 [Bradyrhizobium diazoefficiens]
MGLGDLDELVLSCRNEEGRQYIAEAVACYKAGAYRACIVSAWIAVVYDLLAKVRELALSGDQAAQLIVDDLSKWQPGISRGDQSAIKSSLDLERTIANVANDQFGFFEGMQLVDLERLHADRNRCAHPTYQGTEQPYAPSAELARTHLVHAVRHVLSQAPVQGKAAAAQIIRLVESSFFPTEVEKAKVQFRSAGLDRARESLIRAIVDQLVFGYLEGMPPLKGRPQTACAVRAIAEMYPEICEPRIRRALNSICRRVADTELVFFIGLQKSYSQMWSLLEPDNRTRLGEVVRQCTDDIAQHAIPICVDIPELQDVCRERLSRLGYKELGFAAQQSQHPIIVKAAVDLYCSSKSWDWANANYHAIEPLLSSLNEVEIRRVLMARSNEAADLPGAHSFSAFCRFVYENEIIPRTELFKMLTDQGADYIVRELQREPGSLF